MIVFTRKPRFYRDERVGTLSIVQIGCWKLETLDTIRDSETHIAARRAGAVLNTKNESGATALMYAAVHCPLRVQTSLRGSFSRPQSLALQRTVARETRVFSSVLRLLDRIDRTARIDSRETGRWLRENLQVHSRRGRRPASKTTR